MALSVLACVLMPSFPSFAAAPCVFHEFEGPTALAYDPEGTDKGKPKPALVPCVKISPCNLASLLIIDFAHPLTLGRQRV